MDDQREDREVSGLRARIHKLADAVQESELTQREQAVLIQMMQRQIEVMNATLVNRDLLNATVGTSLAKVEQLHQETVLKFDNVDIKLDHLHGDLVPIRKVIYWTAGIIISAVLMALMSLVLNPPAL